MWVIVRVEHLLSSMLVLSSEVIFTETAEFMVFILAHVLFSIKFVWVRLVS
jgi:hypothetical protein